MQIFRVIALGVANDAFADDLAHTQGYRCITEYDLRAFFVTAQRSLPGNGFFIQRSENDSFFSFQQVIGHEDDFLWR